MIDYNKILKENSYGILATLDDNKPKTRILQYILQLQIIKTFTNS